MLGRKIWFFPDGDIPAAGDKEPFGHESLIILNPNKKNAIINLTVYFEDKKPLEDIKIIVENQRVKCIRLDKPVGEQEFKIPLGQYALGLKSSVPIIAQIGRMDIRQPNLAYYTTMGYSG